MLKACFIMNRVVHYETVSKSDCSSFVKPSGDTELTSDDDRLRPISHA